MDPWIIKEIISLLFFLFVFLIPILGFIYSLLFSSAHQNSGIKKLEKRKAATMNLTGKDILNTQSQPFIVSEISSSSMIAVNVTMGTSWAQSFFASIKSLFGMNLQSFSKVLAYGRNEALQRLREQAMKEGWKEVINVRIETAQIMGKADTDRGGFFEIIAYGTGIK
ncbi:MAG: heavy metal-binding domain-containing protein [Euryarchaeota archaeon]